MTLPGIAWRNIAHAPRRTVAVSLLALCAMALAILGSFLGHGLRSGLTAAVEPFDLLAGYGGSYQMVLNAVFLQDYPAGNIPHRLVRELEADPGVAEAIPLAFGDNYRGYRIVGTDAAIFSHRVGNDRTPPWLRFNQGTPFARGSREAVVGSRAAADLGLKIGDSFVSTHGFARGGDDHGHAPYVVRGILASCNGPYDQAILVDLHAVWEAHGIHPGGPDHDDHDHAHAEECPPDCDEHRGDGDERRVTAIMVKPSGFGDAYRLFTEFSRRHDADLVFPAQVVVRLLAVLGQADWLFRALGYAAGAIAALAIALSLHWSASAREGEAFILRLIGAERREVIAILAWEGLLSILPGLIAGCVAGHAMLAMLAGMMERKASLHVATGVSWLDPLFGLLLLAAGMAGMLLGALHVTRKTA